MKKIEFSKIITLLSMVQFYVVLIASYTYKVDSYVDVGFIATAITVSGGMCATCISYMLKKSQSENLIKIRMGMYEDVKEIELEYNRQMLKYQQKYHMTDEDIYNLKENSNLDDFSAEVISETNSEMVERTVDANSDIQTDTY